MAVPKRKKSKAKTAMRRAQWLRKVSMAGLSICPEPTIRVPPELLELPETA